MPFTMAASLPHGIQPLSHALQPRQGCIAGTRTESVRSGAIDLNIANKESEASWTEIPNIQEGFGVWDVRAWWNEEGTNDRYFTVDFHAFGVSPTNGNFNLWFSTPIEGAEDTGITIESMINHQFSSGGDGDFEYCLESTSRSLNYFRLILTTPA